MTVRVGIVGSGFMGRTWAEVAANHAKGTSLIAVTGGTRATALAADFGIPLEPDLDGLLARDDVDAVVLASPPAGHLAQTLAAAAAGKHLLVEKPMAVTLAECDAMNAAARAAGVVLVVGPSLLPRMPRAGHAARGSAAGLAPRGRPRPLP